MPHLPFRFLHASDFHLEQPLSGISEIPGHLRDLFIEAPYLAAEKVFQAAVLEGVEFIILAGDILNTLLTGPRGLLFLCEQFEKMAASGIGVYWSGGDADPPEDWPTSLNMPSNVHVFPRARVDEYLVQLDGIPVARILGTSRAHELPVRTGEFQPDSTGLFTVAVAYGDADPAMQTRGIHYWALGGRHERNSPAPGQSIVHYCGTSQSRHPFENGVHGCTLAQVDEQNQVRTSLIPCDAVRWLNERVVIEASTTRQDLEALLRDRLHLLREASTKTNLLVSWTISGEGGLMNELHRGRLATELLEGLRAEFGFNPPVIWSIVMETELAEAIPSQWYEQETIRGDFLRGIEQLRMNPAETLAIDDYLPESYRAGTLGAMAMIEEKSMRQQVLHDAAQLGVELLGGAGTNEE
jgi:DNA repair protein SbcD/Mre11